MSTDDELQDISTEHLVAFLGPKGQEKAYAELVHRFLPLVYHTCLRQLRDPHLAEDATQSVFLLLHQKQPDFPTIAAFASWLYRSAVLCSKRLIRDKSRRRRHEGVVAQSPDPRPSEPGPGDEVDPGVWGDVEGLLDDALASLSPRLRETLVLRYLQGMSEVETAQALSCPVGTVSSRIHKAMAKLRAFFARRGFSHSAGFLLAGLSGLSYQAAGAELQAQVVALGTGSTPSAVVQGVAQGVQQQLALAKLKAIGLWSAVTLSCVLGAVGLGGGSPIGSVSEDRFVGFRGDGGGHFAGAQPSTLHWDEASGTGIRWRVPLPNWGSASPIVVGDRVFVVCEPGRVAEDLTLSWPTLFCFDRDDGSLRWRREVAHLSPDHPDAQAWRMALDLQGEANRLFQAKLAGDPDAASRAAELGIHLPRRGGRHARCRIRFDQTPEFERLAREHGLGLSTWSNWGLYIGQAFATPASDGERIYVVTANRSVVCFDLDGRQRWLSWQGGHADGAPPSELYVHSPLLVEDLLIVHAGNRLTAYDKFSGAPRWERPTSVRPYMIGSPVRLDLGEPVIFTASGEVVRARDGALLAEGIGNQAAGAGPVSDGKDRLFITNGSIGGGNQGRARFADRGTVALRLRLDGDGLAIEQLWHNGFACAYSGERTPLYHAERLYMGDDGTVLEADTGDVIRIPDLAPGLRSRHAISMAGGHLFTLSEDGRSAVIDLDGAVVAENRLQIASDTGTKQVQRRYIVGGQVGDGRETTGEWPFTYSLPFFADGDIFIRSNDHLYCIGAKQ